MKCAVHDDVETSISCAVCHKNLCDACAAWEIDGSVACEKCGRIEDDRSRAVGSALFALVGVGYLATVAIGVLVFRAKPFVGGVAAMVAIATGRALQIALKPRAVVRKTDDQRAT